MDYNATTPLAPEVLEAITSTLRDAWGNPSSSYHAGSELDRVKYLLKASVLMQRLTTLFYYLDAGATAKLCIAKARDSVAQMINVAPQGASLLAWVQLCELFTILARVRQQPLPAPPPPPPNSGVHSPYLLWAGRKP